MYGLHPKITMSAALTPRRLSFCKIVTSVAETGNCWMASLIRLADSGRRTQAMKLEGVWKRGFAELLVGDSFVVGVAVPLSG